MTLRPAVPDDLPTVGDLHQRSRVAAYRGFVPVDALNTVTGEMMGQWWSERWRYERHDHQMTVAERDGRLVGFSYLGPDDLEDPSVGLLNAIHLDPDERGRGTGRALMIEALAGMHQRGWRRAALWVLVDNRHARRFYEAGGWTAGPIEREDSIGPVLTRQVRYHRPLP
jgi:GNAT superfamily N-acetyltransferase